MEVRMTDREKSKKIIESYLIPLFNRINKIGLKSSIEEIIPGFHIDDFVMRKIKKSLKKSKSVNAGGFLGRISVYYINDHISVEFAGLIKFFISSIKISNEKIIKILDDIFEQVQLSFFKDDKYLINKIIETISKLSKKEKISKINLEESNTYDLIIISLFNYYNSIEMEFPEWFKEESKNFKRTDFAKDFLNFFIELLIRIFDKISNNVYINYEILFKSKILQFFLNKVTNGGQISNILSFFNVNLREIVNKFAKKYAGETFLKGLGEHLICIIQDLMMGVSDKSNDDVKDNFNFTSCIGMSINSRRFRWFGKDDIDESLEISEDENFINFKEYKAEKEKVILSRPTILNLGTIAKYQIEYKFKYSVEIMDLDPNKEYFLRIRRKSEIYKNKMTINSKSNEFIVMSDSQGMVKQDYDSFVNNLELIHEKFNESQFISHLGDFVDDGYNENYWDFLLNSKVWGQIPVFPLSGNHESKFHPTLRHLGIKNSIINHFNVKFEDKEKVDKGIYYYFEQNDCIYIFINTNISDGLGMEQISCINNILKESKAKWRVLFSHKSPYSCGPHSDDIDIDDLRKDIDEICFKFKFDIVFGGHDHIYSRTYPICLGNITSENIVDNEIINQFGTTFVSLGPIGVKNYKICQKKPLIKILSLSSNPSFCRVRILENKMIIESYEILDKEINIIDKFVISKDLKEYDDSKKVQQCIDNLPDNKLVYCEERANEILNLYNKLPKKNKIRTNKLDRILKYNDAYKEILNGKISVVRNKHEFLNSLNDHEIRTIVVECDSIKLGNVLFKKKIKIDRNLKIVGVTNLKFLSLRALNDYLLILEN